MRIGRRAIMRRAWLAPNGGQGVRRSNFEHIGGQAPARVQRHGILARSGRYGVLAKTSYAAPFAILLPHYETADGGYQ